MKQSKISWKKRLPDGGMTLDWYLYIDGEPTMNLISAASGIYYTYIDDEERALFDTLSEAKQFILEELQLA